MAGLPFFHDDGGEVDVVGAFGHERVDQMAVELGIHVVDVGLDDDRRVLFVRRHRFADHEPENICCPGCPCSLHRGDPAYGHLGKGAEGCSERADDGAPVGVVSSMVIDDE